MWNDRYAQEGFAYGTEPNEFLKSQYAHIPKGGKVLCLAEGEGRNALFLAQQGYDVTAVDQSDVGLIKAQKLADDNGVSIKTVVADLADFSLEEQSWDGIVSIAAHVPPTLRKKIHSEVYHSLKESGVFILEAFTQRQLEMSGIGGPPHKELFMSLVELSDELDGLEFHIATEVDREIFEGKHHQGESAVVQLVAFKRA